MPSSLTAAQVIACWATLSALAAQDITVCRFIRSSFVWGNSRGKVLRAHFYLVPHFRIPYTKEHAVTTPVRPLCCLRRTESNLSGHAGMITRRPVSFSLDSPPPFALMNRL